MIDRTFQIIATLIAVALDYKVFIDMYAIAVRVDILQVPAIFAAAFIGVVSLFALYYIWSSP